jgi:hypothetical protein
MKGPYGGVHRMLCQQYFQRVVIRGQVWQGLERVGLGLVSDQISSVEQVTIKGESHVIMIDEARGRDHAVVKRDGRLAGDRDQGRLAEE